jgi:hypothetical protein
VKKNYFFFAAGLRFAGLRFAAGFAADAAGLRFAGLRFAGFFAATAFFAAGLRFAAVFFAAVFLAAGLRFAGFFAATAFFAAGLRFAAVFFLATAIFFTSSTSATVSSAMSRASLPIAFETGCALLRNILFTLFDTRFVTRSNVFTLFALLLRLLKA